MRSIRIGSLTACTPAGTGCHSHRQAQLLVGGNRRTFLGQPVQQRAERERPRPLGDGTGVHARDIEQRIEHRLQRR